MRVASDTDKRPGFLLPASLEEVERLIDERLRPLSGELISLPLACGRVLAESVVSPYSIPQFHRAAMDGFALRSEDIAAATADSPLELCIVGQSLPNRPYLGELKAKEAIAITTGAPLPAELDSVVKQEDVRIHAEVVQFTFPLPAGKNVSRRGEDVRSGEEILQAGRLLRPQSL